MYMQKRPVRKIGEFKFKRYGIIGCKACAIGWKEKLKGKGKNVRLRQTKEGWEIWST